MPTSCSACTNRYRTGGELHFFGFPLKNEPLLQAWVEATGSQQFTPTKASKLCSKHFVETDFLVRPGTYRQSLKPDAVPSVFEEFPSYLPPKPKPTRVLKRTNTACTGSNSAVENKTTHGQFITDMEVVGHDSISLSTLDKQTQTEKQPEATYSDLKRKIKILQQKLRRKQKKIGNLQEKLKKQKNKGLSHYDVENIQSNQFKEKYSVCHTDCSTPMDRHCYAHKPQSTLLVLLNQEK